MNIKNNIQLLAEASKYDLEAGASLNKSYDAIKEAYENIHESDGFIVTEASDVIVNKIGDEYYVEMVNLYPFMVDSGIHSVSEALDLVAEANFLPKKSVGLALESQEVVDEFLEAAKEKSKKTKNKAHLKNALDKVEKSNAMAKTLKSKGYKVVKKKKGSKVCPKCGKVSSKCTCEWAGSNPAGGMDTLKNTNEGIVDNIKNKIALKQATNSQDTKNAVKDAVLKSPHRTLKLDDLENNNY